MTKEYKLGIVYAVLAFSFWGGIAPIYFKEVANVSAIEVLMFRIVVSFFMLFPLIYIFKQINALKKLLKNFKLIKLLFLSSFFVSLNWLIFIYAISSNHIIEASLGYYINPLVSVIFAYFFFGERMSFKQNIAIFIAFLAITYQVISIGNIPIISLSLAFSFAIYGALRKKLQVDSLIGLFVEVLILFPFALAYILYLSFTSNLSFLNDDLFISFMLLLAGLVTIIPLLLFNSATSRIKLTTLGFLQYIGPSISFLLAIFVYNEEFTIDKLITFILIWTAVIIFSYDAFKRKS